MPVQPTFPGVYIEEVPSGVRTIVGVATSTTAFIDSFRRGPVAPTGPDAGKVSNAVQIFSFADFEREFGGLDTTSEASYAIQQFFLNGGSQAYVVRVAGAGAQAAAITIRDGTGGGAANAFTATAGRRIRNISVADPGAWGNSIRLDVDYDTTAPSTLFNLTVSEVSADGRQILRTETHRNLSMTSAARIVNEASKLVQLSSLGATLPAQAGTVSGAINLGGIAAPLDFNLQLDGGPNVAVTLSGVPASLADARAQLQAAIRAAPGGDPRLTGATVQLINNRFRVLTARTGATPATAFNPATIIAFTNGAGTVADNLGLTAAGGVSANVQQYSLNGAGGAQTGAQPGLDAAPAPNDIIGVRANKTGLFALEDVDLFNILCIPAAAVLSDTEMRAVYSAAEAYCLERRAFLIIDIAPGVDTRQKASDWLDDNSNLRSRNAAVYFPRTRIADPLDNFRLRNIAPGGTMAGLYARTDGERGVWKAPAGVDATLRNVQELAYVLTDPENGSLNPLGVNCLRNFPVYGNVAWGARTLDGADVLASEWKYVPVRRFALFLEESLYRGTKWAVFEPNDEPLWAQIRLNIGAFMQSLFRQGAFQGTTPREAYFVKCDKETTTQDDINRGIVNILVGFAPLKPAEFVIIKISQLAGQIQT